MNTNKKLVLNKQLVANLDSQNMAEVKGGVSWTDFVTYVFTKALEYGYSHGFNAKGQCLTDDTVVFKTIICETNGCGGGTEYNSCYGGSCAKCG